MCRLRVTQYVRPVTRVHLLNSLDAGGTGTSPSDILAKCTSADCLTNCEGAVFDYKFMALGALSFSKVSLLKGLDDGLAACSDHLFRQSSSCSE